MIIGQHDADFVFEHGFTLNKDDHIASLPYDMTTARHSFASHGEKDVARRIAIAIEQE
jgi:hypothetical protein